MTGTESFEGVSSIGSPRPTRGLFRKQNQRTAGICEDQRRRALVLV